MSDEKAAAEKITFEDGYDELKQIASRLGEDDVPVHEMFERFRRGKGLEQQLRSYLAEREGELTEIEQGHNLPAFEIVAPSYPSASSESAPAETSDFAEPAIVSPPGKSDDDIPF